MLFVLAFDHRNSFRRQFFGIQGSATLAQSARARDGKHVIFEGLLAAIRGRVPVEWAGILVDDQYGQDIAPQARAAGVSVAVPVEKSGERELVFEHDPFYEQIERLDPHQAKVLIRYNPDADSSMNARQVEKLLLLQGWARAHSKRVMLELLVPAESDQLDQVGADAARYDRELRPELTLTALAELVAAGVQPEIWKLEGMNSSEEYEAVASVVTSARPDTGLLVLGRGADAEVVDHWLRLAAPVRAFSGFAVGRTLWWDPLRAYFDGRVDRTEAAAQIAANYSRLVEVYLRAAPSIDSTN